jgi:hypothetical protein
MAGQQSHKEDYMKQLLKLVVWSVLVVSVVNTQTYRKVTIKDIQKVPLDSLLVADGLQNSVPARWRLQTSPYYNPTVSARETLEVVAQVVVPAKVVTFTGGGFTMLLRDTASTATDWSGLFARVASGPDTTAMVNSGFLNLERGDIIRLRGYVDEFPANDMNSACQFVPIPSGLQLLSNKPLPKPVSRDLRDFYQGIFPGGKTKWSTGEPWEGVMVEFVGLTITSYVNQTNGTFSMVDVDGNELSVLDVSKWFTLRAHGDTSVSHYKLPPVFTKIDTIRGYITANSGSEALRGYRLAPVFPGDLKLGKILPLINTHRRTPVIPASTDSVVVSAKVFAQTGGVKLGTVTLYTSVNNGAYTAIAMTGPASDSSFTAKIAPQALNTNVKYFVSAVDTSGGRSNLASSASGPSASDTSRGVFFYKVLNSSPTIADIQTTPYANGRTPFLGAVTTVNGVVTADTSDLPLSSTGALPWYIQNGNAAWNGLWISGPDTLLAALRKGDSVSVTGTVQEQFDVTRLGSVTAVTKIASGKTLPTAVTSTTGNFGPSAGNGSSTAEPWESMLVRFNNVTVTDINPTFADLKEYLIDDGSGLVLARSDGNSKYSNVPGDSSLGKTIIRAGNKLSFVQGIVYFSFNRYKFIPRRNADFGTLTTTTVERQDVIPKSFVLEQNFPNPFNPSTTIRYDVPSEQLVTLKVYNILGQEVRMLVNDRQTAGRYTVRMDVAGLPSGMYLYQLVGEGFSLVKKMVLLK